MATVYRPKGRYIWNIKFKDQQGRYKKISSGTDSQEAAEGLARKLEEDAALIRAKLAPHHPELTGVYLGLVPLAPRATTWKEFRKRFEAEYAAGLRERSREKFATVLDVFEQEMRPKGLAEVTEETISRFAAALRARPVRTGGRPTGRVGLAPWTVKNYLIALKTALTWAEEQRLLAAVPKFPAVKVPKTRPQPIPEGDWLKLLAAAPSPLWRAYLLCGWLGGLRLSEAHQLRRSRSEEWPWLDLASDRIIFPARFVKAGEDQWVPLHPDLRVALAALPDVGDEVFPFRSTRNGEPMTRSAMSNAVIRLAEKAGVKLSMHRLRKGFGCRVAQQLGRGNAPVLHRLMRHSSMQITMDFYASVDDVLHDAIRQLDQPSPKSPPPADLAVDKPQGPA